MSDKKVAKRVGRISKGKKKLHKQDCLTRIMVNVLSKAIHRSSCYQYSIFNIFYNFIFSGFQWILDFASFNTIFIKGPINLGGKVLQGHLDNKELLTYCLYQATPISNPVQQFITNLHEQSGMVRGKMTRFHLLSFWEEGGGVKA